MNAINEYEAWVRLGCFIGVLSAMLVWEWLSPKRSDPGTKTRWRRRGQHIALTAVNTLILRLLPGVAAVKAAMLAQEQQWGLLNTLGWRGMGAGLFTLLLLDLAIYLQHRAFHAVPVLWRLHRLHHSDADFDTTTALRFHPIEIVLSMLIKFAVVLALGAPVWVVIVFEVLLNASALFNHGNVRLSTQIDRWLRLAVVTPDMHRVHHSVLPQETDSNFGFNFPWWDRLLGTYRAQPEAGHLAMEIGLKEFPRDRTRRFVDLLAQPFYTAKADKPDTPSTIN